MSKYYLQGQIDEIVRSIRTLDVVIRNPSVLAEIDANKDQVGELVMERHRREVLPTPSNGGSDPDPNDGQAPAPDSALPRSLLIPDVFR